MATRSFYADAQFVNEIRYARGSHTCVRIFLPWRPRPASPGSSLCAVFNELAWTSKLPELAHLLRREDNPRTQLSLPRPLAAEQDHLLQQECLRRNDLGENVFMLLRHSGMIISECADLSYDWVTALRVVSLSRTVNTAPPRLLDSDEFRLARK
jgi:hypothetical protein